MNRRVALLLLSSLAGGQNVLAQAPAAPTPPAVPQYQVEILIFANREFDPNEERFAQELPALPSYAPLQQAPVFDDSNFGQGGQSPQQAATALAADGSEFRFRLLRREELQLGAEYRRLQAISAYVPLLHAGWVQAGLPEADARPFDLSLVGASNPRGNVRVYLSRFLHVNLDLTYQLEGPLPSAGGPALTDELSELAIAPRYRLVTSRQTRSGELHYFDHPAFGVLVRVTPVAPEAVATPPGRPAA